MGESQQVGTQSYTGYFSTRARVSLTLSWQGCCLQGDKPSYHQSNCLDRPGLINAVSALHGQLAMATFILSSAVTQWARIVWSKDMGMAIPGSEGS